MMIIDLSWEALSRSGNHPFCPIMSATRFWLGARLAQNTFRRATGCDGVLVHPHSM
jgi:hypothetical protein